MSDFDSIWATGLALLNKTADEKVGDRIRYSTNGGGAYTVLPGYVILDTDTPTGVGEFDGPLGTRKRVKIRRELLATPLRTHRLQHPLLGEGTFQPTGEGEPQVEGSYWLFDVQKV